MRNGLLRDRTDEIDFFLAVGLAIGVKDFVVPDGRFAIRVGMLPGIPGQISLRLASHQTPVISRCMIFLGDGQRSFKGAVIPASHVFRADERAVIFQEPF